MPKEKQPTRMDLLYGPPAPMEFAICKRGHVSRPGKLCRCLARLLKKK